MSEPKSVSQWIEDLKQGDEDAAAQLWERYFQKMVRAARRKLGGHSLAAADEDPSALTVNLARVLAGRAAIDAGRHCQQVLAGIGFTRDHDFHRYLFAAIELDGLYGTTAALTKQLGRDLIAGRTVPRTIDL